MSDQTPGPQDAKPEAQPAQQSQPASMPKKSNKKMMIILLGGGLFVCLLILIAIIIAFFVANNVVTTPQTSNSNSNSNQQTQSTDTQTQQAVATEADNKIFYVKDNNIFEYDTESAVTIELTTYPINSSTSVSNLKVVNGSTLGYAKCTVVVGDFGCEVDVLDIATKAVTVKKTLDASMLILTVGFDTPDKFGYLVTTDTKWQVYYDNAGTLTTLEDIDITAYGRGGYNEDSEKIGFSKDGKYMLEISTSSPRAVSDFNIYVYNLAAGTSKIISKGTQPTWIDNTKVLFRVIDKDDATKNGLATYDVVSDVQTKLPGVQTTSYNPTLLTGTQKVIFSDMDTNEVWSYDLTTHAVTKLASNALFGVWVNSSKILYTATETCVVGDETCGMMGGNYKVLSYDVLDTTTSGKVSLPVDVNSVYVTATQYSD